MTTNALTVQLASGDALDVREFHVEESMSRLFEIQLEAVASSPDADFEAAIGQPARFEILRKSPVDGETRYWSGICARIGQVGVDDTATGLSSYAVRIVPVMWLLTQRRNYRIFQDMSELDIVETLLSEWGITPTLRLDAESYLDRRMRVQYGETDFDFVNRLLEDIGVAYYFEQSGGSTSLVLADAPNRAAPRPPVVFVEKPNDRLDHEYVTDVRTHRELRPGRYTQSDVDYRKALNYPLAASAAAGNTVESKLERYHHDYGSFLWKAQDAGQDTPTADDRGPARTNEAAGAVQVQKRLDAARGDARVCSLTSVAYDLRPGKVFTIASHPRSEVAAPLLVVEARFKGRSSGQWEQACECRYTDLDYRPPLRTPRPRTNGVESATATGPAGEQIHTDEFGRMRVQFHWNRDGVANETSSCWVPVSQPFAGTGFGNISLVRVGQEVLVDFLGADPDRPVVVGRVYTLTNPPPYQLPKYKMVSGHRSQTYPQPGAAPAQARLGGGPADRESLTAPAQPLGGGVPLSAIGGDPAPSAGSTPSAAPAQALPGLTGAPQASIADLNNTVDQLKSQGPDLMDHHRSANAVVHDDTANSERLYIQAQKNLYETVKNDLIGSVGGNRGFTVLGNDTAVVQNFQMTEVGKDRSVAVAGKQVHMVTGNIDVTGLANMTTVTPKGMQTHMAKLALLLQVEGSTIFMLPDGIVIDSKEVFINPGATMMGALFDGKSIADAKAAQQALNAKIEANQKQIDKMTREFAEDKKNLALGLSYAPNVPPEAYKMIADRDAERQAQIDSLTAQNNALKAQQ